MHRNIPRTFSQSFFFGGGAKQGNPLLSQPLYSRDSALAFLFPILKTAIKASGFEAVSLIQQSVAREEKPFSRAIDSLHARCERCAEAGGAYIE
jgi:hypothetical protein